LAKVIEKSVPEFGTRTKADVKNKSLQTDERVIKSFALNDRKLALLYMAVTKFLDIATKVRPE